MRLQPLKLRVGSHSTHTNFLTCQYLSVGYKINDNVTIGIKGERSFRRGWDRINGHQRSTVDYDRETGTEYDLFLRASSGDGRWHLNANVFRADIDDQQIEFCFSDNFLDCHIVNAAESRKTGAELDSWVQTEHIRVWFGASWLDAEFRSFDVPGFEGQVNRPLPNAPDWKFSTGIIYETARFFASGELIARPGTPGDVTASLIENEGRTLLNGRVGYRFGNGLELSLWGRNLLDEEYFDHLQPNAPGAYVGAPREIGVSVSKEWGR